MIPRNRLLITRRHALVSPPPYTTPFSPLALRSVIPSPTHLLPLLSTHPHPISSPVTRLPTISPLSSPLSSSIIPRHPLTPPFFTSIAHNYITFGGGGGGFFGVFGDNVPGVQEAGKVAKGAEEEVEEGVEGAEGALYPNCRVCELEGGRMRTGEGKGGGKWEERYTCDGRKEDRN